jgi:hypothetical protein
MSETPGAISASSTEIALKVIIPFSHLSEPNGVQTV